MDQWPGGSGAGFPIQGSCVQNHRVAPWSPVFHPSEVVKISTRDF